MSIVVKNEEKIAKLLKTAESINAQSPEVQEHALNDAVKRGDEESAAVIARAIRDRLLKESDAELAVDRMGLEVPSGNTFVAWLDFFKGLGEMLNGKWAQYRQELRDLPQQEGFPLNTEFPEKPDGK